MRSETRFVFHVSRERPVLPKAVLALPVCQEVSALSTKRHVLFAKLVLILRFLALLLVRYVKKASIKELQDKLVALLAAQENTPRVWVSLLAPRVN